jgi:hypothetical protein
MHHRSDSAQGPARASPSKELSPVRRFVCVAALAACSASPPSRAAAQVLIPHQMHHTSTFELHSVNDDVQLYEGDPQLLLRIEVRPERSLPPKVEFSNSNQVVVLRVLDLSLFEPAVLDSARLADNEALGIDEDPQAPAAVAQHWQVELAPAAATDFFLHCEGGKGQFDFTDLPVREVHLLADTTDVRVEFDRPNPAELRRFKLTAFGGRLDVRGFLNARARSVTFQVAGAQADIQLLGKTWDGESEIFFEGVPARLRMTLPKQIGLHVEGPSVTVARFDRDGMAVVGTALEDGDFAARSCRLRLYFSQAVPQMDVRWEDAD